MTDERVTRLLIEYARSPLAIGTRTPRFFWEIPLPGRGRKQSGYQILVATEESLLETGTTDLWDSGKVESTQSSQVEYAGKELPSNIDCYWAVQIWDEKGKPQGFAAPQKFGTALLDESDWQATWIGMGPMEEPEFDPYSLNQSDATNGLQLSEEDFQLMAPEFRNLKPDVRAPMLRKAFALDKPVKRARAFVCGLGLFELRLNGKKVGNDVLNTPRTEFRKRAFYVTYDITDDLESGENALGLFLGNGWYNAQKKFWHWQAPWYGSPRAIVQVEIEFDDGTQERVVSDSSWKGDWSPIALNCIYDGEDYDARLEQEGWDAPGFDASAWQSVNVVAAPGGKLTAMDHEPNKVMKRFSPVSIVEPEPGVFVFDMGTVMTGWARLTMPQGRAGETVVLHYAECQHENGMIDPNTNVGARQSERYTMKGEAGEGYEPHFTYHGFRYVELSGFPGTPTLDTLEACFVYSGVEEIGSFDCGNELLNKIHACTIQSQKCNIQMGVPTDDTQREERLGWCADAWSFAEECFYNFDSPRLWSKWIADFYDQQDENGMVGYITPLPGFCEDMVWSAALVLIPWWHYQHYGDRRILEKSYPYLKKYLAYLERVGEKEVRSLAWGEVEKALLPKCGIENRFPSPANRGHLQRSLFGDHLATSEGAIGMCNDTPQSMPTAFYYRDVTTMIRIAETLGYKEDAARYTTLAEGIKDAYNDAFFDAGNMYYDNGCHSAQALSLSFGLVPDEVRPRVLGYLRRSIAGRQKRITSGYAGTKWVVDTLSNNGEEKVLWDRLMSTDYPSWAYMLHDDKTTIPEGWDGAGSQCHTTLGAAIDEWFYWGLAGIRPDANGPGYEKITIKPYLPGDLPWARASINTARGVIRSSWTQDDSAATLEVTVPANSTAAVHIPTPDADAIREGGVPAAEAEGVASVRSDDDNTVFIMGSGNYRFEWKK
jgi:alpha-L-rhamnosidase